MENSPIDFNTEKQWKNESNDKLKDRGSSNRVFNMNYIYIAFILIGVGMVGVFYYLGTNDYFKSNVSNECQAQICGNLTCPSITCGSCSVNLSCSSNSTAISNLTLNVNNTYVNSS